MFFILVPFLIRAPCIIIHLARNAEKGGGVLMSIILPNLNHSFVPDSGSGFRFRFRIPDSGFRFRFRIPDFLVFHTPLICKTKNLQPNACLYKIENRQSYPPDATAPLLISKMFISFLWSLDFLFSPGFGIIQRHFNDL